MFTYFTHYIYYFIFYISEPKRIFQEVNLHDTNCENKICELCEILEMLTKIIQCH